MKCKCKSRRPKGLSKIKCKFIYEQKAFTHDNKADYAHLIHYKH
jgi:hypothetical protein